jgi:hypothetical protein
MHDHTTQIFNTKLPTPRTGHPVTYEQAITAMRNSNAEELKQSLISALQLIRESNSPDFEGGFPNMTSTVAPLLDVYDPATLESGHNILKAWKDHRATSAQSPNSAREDNTWATSAEKILAALTLRTQNPTTATAAYQNQLAETVIKVTTDLIDLEANQLLAVLLEKKTDDWFRALKKPALS